MNTKIIRENELFEQSSGKVASKIIEVLDPARSKYSDEHVQGSESSDSEEIDGEAMTTDIMKMLSLTEERFSHRGEAGDQTEQDLFGVYYKIKS